MKLGIKVGLQPSSFDDLDATHPDLAEVWFDINRQDEYKNLFTKLREMHIDVGLHFWGVLKDQTWTNITYPDVSVNASSLDLMSQTIDIASENGFKYVNIHPTPNAMVTLDLQTFTFGVRKPSVSLDMGVNNFLSNVGMLNTYAIEKNVVLTVETVPPRVKTNASDPTDTTHTLDIFELPPDALKRAAERGVHIANDFGHTVANCQTDNPEMLYTYLYDITKRLAPKTRLIHVGYVIPPHNGTDLHGSLDNPDFRTKAVPNETQMIQLLKLFKNRDDVWALVEPYKDHIKNYFLLKQLQETANKE